MSTQRTLGLWRSLLSSTDSSQNPVESRQFPGFQRNQIWQRGLPNRSNDSNGISNGIQILLEWFLESPRRNEFPEFNGMESHNTYNAQPWPNQLSVFANDQFGCGQQPQTLLSHNYHHPQHSPSIATLLMSPAPTTTSNHHQLPSMTTACLNPAKTRQQHHITLKNKVTMPRHQMNKHPPGATSPTAMWQPDDEQQHCCSSSFTPS